MAQQAPPQKLDAAVKQKVQYCIPLWLRDEQIKLNTARVRGRIEGDFAVTRPDKIAIVCYGPSLNDTWEQLKDFEYIMSCSGAHKFLLDHGIVPTWQAEVDPREHKITLLGEPNPQTIYIPASTCHPKYFEYLLARVPEDHVRMWHVFDDAEDAKRVLPHGEWALTGGASVGLRSLVLARFFGFTNQHIFGMDGSFREDVGKHAAAHPNQPQKHSVTVYNGREFMTNPAVLEVARQTWHELDQLKDVQATFYGDGLVQEMAKDYKRKVKTTDNLLVLGMRKVDLISPEYRELNARLHRENLAYGVGAGKHAETVKKLLATLQMQDGLPLAVLDYGCGKGYLQKALPFPIFEYDPSIPGKEESPRVADLVCCLDVLEHIEPEKLVFVLKDLQRVTKQVGYFVINMKAAAKTLPDGRNTHLIQQGREWWERQLEPYFTIGKIIENGPELHVIVAPAPISKLLNKAAETVRPRLSLDAIDWRREPYHIARVANILDPVWYGELAANFPPFELFRAFGGTNKKWSLSTVNHPDRYAEFLGKTPTWHDFHLFIKGAEFLEAVTAALKREGITLPPVKPRWEFSLLPAVGGCLRPHTDISSKVITVIIGMEPPENTWDASWGGGTAVLVPKGTLPLIDYEAEFEEFTRVDSLPYGPNAGVLFVKSANSWHGVAPMTGPLDRWRKTVTINLEKK